MRAFIRTTAFAFLILPAGAGPLVAQAPGTAARPDFSAALDAADAAEIFVIPQDMAFVRTPDLLTVRALGCRYIVRRDSAAWRDLQAALRTVVIRPAPRRLSGEMRLGLVLMDRSGVRFEAYASWPVPGAGGARGVSQREEVEVSANFAATLEGFAASHPELAMPVVRLAGICPSGRAAAAVAQTAH